MKKLPSREKVLSHDHTWIVVKEKLEFRTPLVSLPGKSHGHRSLVGCSPWGAKELGITEQLILHLSEVTHLDALTLNFAFKHSSLFGSF